MLRSVKAPLVAQRVKNLSAVWETWVQSLGWEYLLEEGMNPLQYSCLENPHGQRNLVSYNPGVTKSQTQLSEEAHKKHKTLLIQNAVAAWQAEDHSLRVICTLRLPFYSPCGCSKITNLGHLQCQKTDIISHSFV